MSAAVFELRAGGVAVGLACDGTPPAAGAVFSVHPDGNHGDNQTSITSGGVL